MVFVDRPVGSEEAKIRRGGAPTARRYAALVNAQLLANRGTAGETAESPPGHCRQRALRHQDPSLWEGADAPLRGADIADGVAENFAVTASTLPRNKSSPRLFGVAS